jgi:hypothetical protein
MELDSVPDPAFMEVITRCSSVAGSRGRRPVTPVRALCASSETPGLIPASDAPSFETLSAILDTLSMRLVTTFNELDVPSES